MGRLLALAMTLVLAALLAWADAQPPRVRGLDTPATAFSAARAMSDVRAMGSVPHPVGSPANHAVRDTLVRRMTALGLSPQVRPGRGVEQPKWLGGALNGGDVENVVGVLPGRDRNAPAVALMAHYDSVPGSAGAADDITGVASALEIVRAIKARGVPARDVMVVITDGEEAGLLGANAFFNRDPLARHVGFVFNMEARGAGGRVQMFQTGERNGGAIDLLRRTAARPQASSLTGFIYARMPNDTDFTESRAVGLAGLNYAFIGRQFDYHSPTATPANLEQGTLQDMGDQVLSTAAAAAFDPALPGRTPDVVYGQLFANAVIAYPPVVGWLVLAAAAALIALGAIRGRRLDPFPWSDVLRGAGMAAYAVASGVAVLHLARQATGAAVGFLEQRMLLAQVTTWETAAMLLALGVLVFAAAELARGRRLAAVALPLVAALGACLLTRGLDKVGLGAGLVAALLALAVLGRPVSRPGAWTGVLAAGLLVGVVAQILAPPAAYVVAWPLLLASLAAAATAVSARRSYGALAVLALLAILALAWIAGIAHAAFLSLDLPEMLALPIFLGAMSLWPLAQPQEGAPPARLAGPALMAAGVVALLYVRLHSPWDARHPQVTLVVYDIDHSAGKAWRLSAGDQRTDWSDAVLRADGGTIRKLASPLFTRPVDAAPAKLLPGAPATVTLAPQPDGSLILHATPPAGARVLSLQLQPDTAVFMTSLAGLPLKPMSLSPTKPTRVRWEAPPAAGIELVLKPAGPGKLKVVTIATTEQWPAGAAPLPPRPANLMAFDLSDSTAVSSEQTLSW
jgi:hypothetical protein